MSIGYNPSIVTANLALCLDAGNPRSYPGTGSTWTDISGNSRNATLVSSPTYTSGINGYFTLNGVDQYATISNYSGINFNTSTVIYIAWLNSVPNSRNTIFSQYYGGTGAQFEWGDTGNLRSNYRQNSAATPENDAANGANQIVTSTIYHITVTYNTGGVITHYKNAVLLGSNTNSTQSNINGGGNIDIGRNSSAGLYFKGRVFYCAIYNSVLTQAQVSQNFEALRGRYGI